MTGEILTPEAIRDRVKGIRKLAGDPDAAHEAEDALRKRVLTAIAPHHHPDHRLPRLQQRAGRPAV